jgi:glycerol-3-phosphate dehydrogenase
MHAPVLSSLRDRHYDVLVVGGGITGTGIARDAALRGLRTALVEQDDFASGTSSRSSRLIHGGVRYLEHRHFHLVFEASRERRTLLRIAPHLVTPLRFVWPVYQGARVPGWKLGAGLLLYDALSLWRNVARHRRLSASAVLIREPRLEAHGLTGGAEYYDAATDDARLTLANALAADQAGATVVNHAAVRGVVRDADGWVSGARVHHTLTGEEIEVAAEVVVNATGPWTDEIRRLADPESPRTVRGSKGVHIAVPAERVGNRGAVTLLSALDGRVMFVLPAGHHTIIGTTEAEARAGPGEVRASVSDVEYLLESANAAFPHAHLTREDVVSAWAGIRPLAAAAQTRGEDPAGASREHAITTDPSGMLTVTGGKLTTYRAMAAEVVDAVEAALGRPPTPSRTAVLGLPGATRMADIDALAVAKPSLDEPVSPGLPYRGAELIYAVQCERALTLSDLLMRRTHIAFETRDAGRTAAGRAAEIVAPLLDWNATDRAAAVAAYEKDAERVFGIDP